MSLSIEEIKAQRAKTRQITPSVLPTQKTTGFGKALEIERKIFTEPTKRVLGGALKFLDFIERPYYTSMELARTAISPEKESLAETLKGGLITGKIKTGFGDVLTEAGWQPETMWGKVAKGGVSFIGGVAFDLITYLSLGAGKGLPMMGKVLSKYGTDDFLKVLSNLSGKKILSVKDIKKYGKFVTPIFEKASAIIKPKALLNPELYFNPTALRFMGHEFPKSAEVLKGIRKIIPKSFEAIAKLPIAGKFIEVGGLKIQKTIGDLFSPGYGIINSKNLSAVEKVKFLDKIEEARNLKAWTKTLNYHKARNLFQGLSKNERKQVSFEIEKFLPDYDDITKTFIPSTYSLNKIKNEKVRKVVSIFQDDMKAIWDDEVKLGIRKATDKSIGEGYIKRMVKGFVDPTEVNLDPYAARIAGVPTIEKAEQLRKAGKIKYYFETNAAKSYLGALNSYTVKKINKQMTDKLITEGFVFKELPEQVIEEVGKLPVKMKEFEFYGKKLYALPEVAEQIKRVAPELTDKGIRKFLSMFDEVQNAIKLSWTGIWPSFHFRNVFSNIFLGWLGGNKNPKNYTLATNLQIYAWNVLNGKSPVDEIVDVGIRGKMKMSELMNAMGEKGVLGTGWMGADFFEKHIPVVNLEMFERIYTSPRRFGTMVENNARIALFVDQLKKGADFDTAAMQVNKFAFNYGSLTTFEKEVMRRFIPFYTWFRKNIPLMVNQIIEQPAKFTAISHLKEGIEEMSKADEEKFLPEFMRTDEMFIRMPGGYYYNPDLPFQDLAKLTFGASSLTFLTSSITPLISGLFEVAANYDIFKGKPLVDQQLPKEIRTREAIKQELLNKMRFTTMYKKATSEQRSIFLKLLDMIFGVNLIPYDRIKGMQNYYRRIQREQGAIRRLERK